MRSTRFAMLAATGLLTAVSPATASAAKDDFCPIAQKVCAKMPWDRYAITGVYLDGETTAEEVTSSHTFTMEGTTGYGAAPGDLKARFETVQKGLATVTAEPVHIEIRSKATYSTGDAVFDCSLPKLNDPNAGLAGVAVLRGGKVRIQWSFGSAGWGCGGNGPDSPITPTSGTPPKDFTTTVHDVSEFRGKKVKLKVRLDHEWESGDLRATQTWRGDVTLTRVA
ncbi:MAG TPA: hypothetical protein VIL49_01805 [Capillimicrobium sp.]|jgi:hypothetical protein